jgi:flagellar basal body P-ring protein FlgI
VPDEECVVVSACEAAAGVDAGWLLDVVVASLLAAGALLAGTLLVGAELLDGVG